MKRIGKGKVPAANVTVNQSAISRGKVGIVELNLVLMLKIFGEVRCVRRGRCFNRELWQGSIELCNVCVQAFGFDSALRSPLLTRMASSQNARQGAGLHFAGCQSFLLWPVIGAFVNLQAPCVLYIGQAFCYSPENAFYIFNNKYIYHYLIFAWRCIIDINNIDSQLDETITAY